jgi:hypothetical protein
LAAEQEPQDKDSRVALIPRQETLLLALAAEVELVAAHQMQQ